MNERMMDLAEKAWDETALSKDFGHPVSFAEKFAELIIQDCMRVVKASGAADTMVPIIAIRRHFGVDE